SPKVATGFGAAIASSGGASKGDPVFAMRSLMRRSSSLAADFVAASLSRLKRAHDPSGFRYPMSMTRMRFPRRSSSRTAMRALLAAMPRAFRAGDGSSGPGRAPRIFGRGPRLAEPHLPPPPDAARDDAVPARLDHAADEPGVRGERVAQHPDGHRQEG